MLDLTKNKRSLSEFKRNTGRFMRRLRESGNPVILTVNGKAELVVQEAAAYQRLLNEKAEAQTVHAIRRGLVDLEQGRTKPARQALARIRRKFKVPRNT